ncbi:unnamed protein product [Heligmosomoides polygyrus]|uniref:Transmembrane protein n=1 Tax=Heligmosomoides polygyrus TaxID=6339 RepID=A0A183F6R3_HELPZ|nr:unnamed protein product [Heligmosomoides polygyrus]
MVDTVYMMRLYTPLWVGMLTFINPWMIILMNRELRRMVFCRHVVDENSSVFPVGPMSRTKRKAATDDRD